METNLNINALSRHRQMKNPILQAILILIVIIVFGWFVLAPKYSASNATRTELAALREQHANLQNDQVELNRLIALMQSSGDEIRLLDEAVPLSDRSTRIALLLETYAQNSAMLLTQLNIGTVDTSPVAGNKTLLENPYGAQRDLNTIDVNISVSGSIEQFRNFLQLLEQSGRIIDVDNLTINSGDDANSNSYGLRLKTYAYEPQ